MALLNYSPQKVIVSVFGYTLEGYVDGEYITIEKDVQPYTTKTSMDGETSRQYTKDSIFHVTVTIAQSSMSNNVLTTIHNVDLATQLAKFPLLIRDRSGSAFFFSPNSWIENFPKQSFTNGVEGRTWSFCCTNSVLSVGGNGNENTALAAISGIASLSSLISS